MTPSRKIVPALDKMSLRLALNFVNIFHPHVEAFKVHDVADAELASVIRHLKQEGAEQIWSDEKLCDTPDTVAARAAKIAESGADWLTVHAGGGPAMVEAAVKNGPGKIIAITALTSLTDQQIKDLYHCEPSEAVSFLAHWAKDGGAHALVCSPKQVKTLADDPKLVGMELIVPGTRSANVANNDQQQVDTPYNAIRNGATYLVGGRQLTTSANPLNALIDMAEEIASAIADIPF